MKDTRGSFGVASSRSSLFSPGSTLRDNASVMGQSQYEWSKQSIDAINQGVVAEKRAMRRMISVENDNKGTGLVGSSISSY